MGYKLYEFCIIACNSMVYININWIYAHSWKFYSEKTLFFAKKCVFLAKFAIFGHYDHIIRSKTSLTWFISSKMLCLIELRLNKLFNVTLLLKFGHKTHIFNEKICFFAVFGLFDHIINSKVSLAGIHTPKYCISSSYDNTN